MFLNDLITEIDNRIFFFFNKRKKIETKSYTSCAWLESGVCFDNGTTGSNVKLCCYLSAPGGGNAMIFTDYHGEKINWRKFFEIKNQYRKVQQSGQTVEQCRGCIFFETKEWTNKDYIDSIIVDHFTRCNCNCVYCPYVQDLYWRVSLRWSVRFQSPPVLPGQKSLHRACCHQTCHS